VEEAKEVLERFVEEYNRFYPHSALGQLSPLEKEANYYKIYKIQEVSDEYSTNFTQKVPPF